MTNFSTLATTTLTLLFTSTATTAFTFVAPSTKLSSTSSGWIQTPPQYRHSRPLCMAEGEGEGEGAEEEEPKLVIDDIDTQLQKLSGKFPTSAVDYLAAARKRAEEKRESVNSSSTAEDWMKLANEKQKEAGSEDADGWEKSLEDADNAENQIFIPIL